MSWHYFDIQFGTLGKLISAIWVIEELYPFIFCDFSFISIVFIKFHEYSTYISFDNYHKIKYYV